MMNTATIKRKIPSSAKSESRNGKTSATKKRGKAEKKSPWTPIVIFLIFAGLVAYMFSPNVPNSQSSGSQSSMNGLANTLAK
jgi:hypothetical protein